MNIKLKGYTKKFTKGFVDTTTGELLGEEMIYFVEGCLIFLFFFYLIFFSFSEGSKGFQCLLQKECVNEDEIFYVAQENPSQEFQSIFFFFQ